MKKIILCFLIFLGCVCLSSCSNTVNHVSFTYNGQEVEIDKSMSGKEVYKIIKKIYDSNSTEPYTLSLYPDFTSSFQLKNETYRMKKYENYLYDYTILNESSKETYQDTYKQYNSFYDQTEDEHTLHAQIDKFYSVKNTKEQKEEKHYLDFYGVQSTLKAGQEGYQEGDMDRHYQEVSYCASNLFLDAEVKKHSTKYYNSYSDLFESTSDAYSFSKVEGLIRDAMSFSKIAIYFIDDISDTYKDYVHYEYSLTNKVIRLDYRVDFDLYMIFNLMNTSEHEQTILKYLEEAKDNGDSYSMTLEISYNSKKEELPSIFKILQENVSYKKESGSYDSSVSDSTLIGKKYSCYEERKTRVEFEHLSLNKKEVDKLKDALIAKVEN